MKSPPFFPIHPSDFLSDDRFAFLTLEEMGAVFLLLMWQWQTGSIPDDHAKLAVICKTDKEVITRLYPAIKQAFSELLENGLMRNRWLHDTREKLLLTRGKMADGGKAGMQRRWASAKGADKVVITTITRTEQEQEQEQKDNTTPTPHTPRKRGESIEYSPEFLAFWSAYPKRTGKGAAWNAWLKAQIKNGQCELILSAIAAQAKSRAWTKDGGAYIPLPATWLNQRRWEDDPDNSGPAANLRLPADEARLAARRAEFIGLREVGQ